MRNPTIDAIIRLEKWLEGAPNIMLRGDVRLLLDTVREAEGLAFDLEQIEALYRKLRDDVDALQRRGVFASVR